MRARCGNRLRRGSTILSIASTEAVGNYRVRAGGEQEQLDRGFSVNCAGGDEPAGARARRRRSREGAWEASETRVARTRDEIELRVGLGRVGRELFPALILAVALVMAAEQLLANRFYARRRAE